MIMSRVWAMPNSRTFTIKPIADIIKRYAFGTIIDPFSNNNKLATVTNDIDPECDTNYHMDATDFLKMFGDNSVDTVLYDPPYSSRQVAECYKKFDRTVNMETTQSSYWSNQKKEISRIVKPGGIVVSCSWNSGGLERSTALKSLKSYSFPMVDGTMIPS